MESLPRRSAILGRFELFGGELFGGDWRLTNLRNLILSWGIPRDYTEEIGHYPGETGEWRLMWAEADWRLSMGD
jgi:hypothetical protein